MSVAAAMLSASINYPMRARSRGSARRHNVLPTRSAISRPGGVWEAAHHCRRGLRGGSASFKSALMHADEIADLAPRSPAQSDLHRGHSGQEGFQFRAGATRRLSSCSEFERVIFTGRLSPKITKRANFEREKCARQSGAAFRSHCPTPATFLQEQQKSATTAGMRP